MSKHNQLQFHRCVSDKIVLFYHVRYELHQKYALLRYWNTNNAIIPTHRKRHAKNENPIRVICK